MTDPATDAATHGFSRGQIVRIIAKHPHNRTPDEQAAIAALVAAEKETLT